VGKNNISIPTLHLPERVSNPSNEPREDKRRDWSPNNRQEIEAKDIKEVYEIEEVVVLTDKIKKLPLG